VTRPITDALTEVRERIVAAAQRAGRDPADVRLIGASKTVRTDRLTEALDAGLTDLGENRAQELLAKAPVLAGHVAPPTWHFVGQLQRNKVGGLVPWVRCWHSVDRFSLGESIARRAPGARVLVEVNLGREPHKGGAAPDEAATLVSELRALDLDVAGLMTVVPQAGERRAWFTALRDLALTLQLRELSMGMSDDFEAAVEEGATMVRVGRAIFGERSADAG
jgi:pyridoxal phosphate enzyme (YggS family)